MSTELIGQTCPDCKGGGRYVSLQADEPCRACEGVGVLMGGDPAIQVLQAMQTLSEDPKRLGVSSIYADYHSLCTPHDSLGHYYLTDYLAADEDWDVCVDSIGRYKVLLFIDDLEIGPVEVLGVHRRLSVHWPPQTVRGDLMIYAPGTQASALWSPPSPNWQQGHI